MVFDIPQKSVFPFLPYLVFMAFFSLTFPYWLVRSVYDYFKERNEDDEDWQQNRMTLLWFGAIMLMFAVLLIVNYTFFLRS